MNKAIRRQLIAISRLAICNPFSPRRFQIEKEILGNECEPFDSVAWNRKTEKREGDRPNVIRLTELAGEIVAKVVNQKELPTELKNEYWDVATYLLLYRHVTRLPVDRLGSTDKRNQQQIVECWTDFWRDFQEIFDIAGMYLIDEKTAAHLFACLVQIHRAFFNIFDFILGESIPIAHLREKVWESVFTRDIRRYHDRLFDRMRDLSTLVTGPSGTGKELVARAIGLSQYVPFDPNSSQFVFDSENSFLPLNLSALSPTLIESELFGHRKGAFTGAVVDRIGWLESCSKYGAVFLDEIGELDPGLQVKLLRVVQQRTYCRLGETKERIFEGKIVAATNRNLSDEISARRFREDFYFRICTDRIETPSLRKQLDDRPEDLQWLVGSIIRKQLGNDCDSLTEEVVNWISGNLGDSYPWNGNIRELEQCVSSYIIREEYVPIIVETGNSKNDLPSWLRPIIDSSLTAEQLTSRYCTWLYWKHGSYEKASQILKIDRRTVKSKVDIELLNELKSN